MQNVTQTRDLWSYRDRSELGSNVVDTHADISGFSVEAVDTILEIGDAEVGVVGTKGFVGGFQGPRSPISARPELRQIYQETSLEVEALERGSTAARSGGSGSGCGSGSGNGGGGSSGLGSGGMGIGGPGSMSIWASVLVFTSRLCPEGARSKRSGSKVSSDDAFAGGPYPGIRLTCRGPSGREASPSGSSTRP